MKTAKDFEIGDCVTHVTHGSGRITAYDIGDDSAIFVEFDKEPEDWGPGPLCVSAHLLTKVESQDE